MQSVTTVPHRSHLADNGAKETEPSVYMTMSGEENGVWSRVVVRRATYSVAFLLDLDLLKSPRIPMVCGLNSFQKEV